MFSIIIYENTMLNIFLQYLQNEKRYSQHTIKAYQSDLEQLIASMEIVEDDIKLLTHKELRVWCSRMIEKGLSARSVNRKLSAAGAFFAYLLRQGIVEQNPVDKVINPKNIKRLPFFYDEKQMQDMLDGEQNAAQSQDHSTTTSIEYIAQRNHTIMEVFYGTGMRLSELIGLQVGDIDMNRLNIKVLGKRKKERLIPLSPHLAKELEQYMAVYRQHFEPQMARPLFLTPQGKSMNAGQVYYLIHKTLKNQGISGKKSPHVLRHTFATHLLNNGADLSSIKDLLGHASLSATQVYTHNNIDKLMRSYEQAHPHA
jgi:integrase/recombinase XerC